MDALDRMQEAEAAMHDRAVAAARPRGGTRSASRGICAKCGAPIAPARLEALPSASTCIDCQREIELEAS